MEHHSIISEEHAESTPSNSTFIRFKAHGQILEPLIIFNFTTLI